MGGGGYGGKLILYGSQGMTGADLTPPPPAAKRLVYVPKYMSCLQSQINVI